MVALTWDEDKSQWAGGPAIANVGGTYTATEQGIINAMLAVLRDAGLIALD